MNPALERAIQYRVERAQIRRALSDRRSPLVGEILRDPPRCVHTLTVEKFLRWLPRVGEKSAAAMMGAAGVTEWTTLGSATDRQRKAVLAVLQTRRARTPRARL